MQKIIAVDFDGTLVEHHYPKLGPDVPYAFETLRELQGKGFKLILWTVRNNKGLKEAVDYCRSKGIEFWGINENPGQKYWASGPKAYAPYYIDDAAVGCPLIQKKGEEPFVDWIKVKEILQIKGVL